MITEYIDAAMRKARYQHIVGEHIYFGKIPDFKGLWASGKTKAACEAELRERLEEWIVLGLRMNMALPVLGRLTLNKTLSPVKADFVHA
jgi:predicted RNase H-like HicB family nuclease